MTDAKVQTPQKEQEHQPTRMDGVELHILKLAEQMQQMTEMIELVIANESQPSDGLDSEALAQAVAKELVAQIGGGNGHKGAVRGGAHKGPKKVFDTKTKTTYDSLGACGKVVAAEMGLDVEDKWVYYACKKTAPDRFIEENDPKFEGAKS